MAAIAATSRAREQHIGTDFHVFWQAGYDFAHGLPLYQPLQGARRFIYPPFAAQVFQILGVFPLKTAAWLFYLASVGLVCVAVKLLRDIDQRLQPTRQHRHISLVLAIVFSANFILDNLNMVQVNLLVFVLCLLGIQALVQKRELAAGGWIVAATALKLTPVFLVLWAMVRGTRKTWGAVAGFGFLSLTLPVIQRGFAQGVVDLTTYYQSFLHEFASGKVVASYRNQNLASMIYRASVPGSSGDLSAYDYAYMPSLASAAPLIYRMMAATILAAFLICLIRLRASGRAIGALEISSVFLASHLLSGITWKAHLVTLLFVAHAFFSLEMKRFSSAGRIALGLAWGGIAVIGLGRDVIGSRLHHYTGGYSVIAWVMLLLFTLSLVWAGKRNSVSGEKTA